MSNLKQRRMEPKNMKEKKGRVQDAPASDSDSGSSSYLGFIPWIIAAIILAGLSFLWTNYQYPAGISSSAVTTLPESYAVCTEPGKIYTVDEDKPNVECILVSKGKIMTTGTYDEVHGHWDEYQNELIKKFYGNEPKAKKRLNVFRTPSESIVVPGLSDAHAHLISYGFKMQLQLDLARSLDEILDILESYVLKHPEINVDPSRWIEGMGWDQTRWTNWSGEFPTAAHLASREALVGRPISLSRVDGHALWVSERVLELAQKQLPDGKWPTDGEVEGGEIKRDTDGKPNGVFVDNAMSLVHSPPWTPERMDTYLETAMEDALKVGLTSVHDAQATAEFIETFQRAAEEGRLPVRVYAMGNSENTTYWGGLIPRLDDYEDRLNIKSIKLFTDGALGSWGAALLEPYSDKPDTTGIMRGSPEALEDMVEKFWADGWGVNIHCIGDRANKVVLDILERVMTKESKKTGEDTKAVADRRRPRIEHAQIMRLEDLERAGRLGIITSVQPTHATSDMWYAETRLGPERIKGAYAYQTLLQASANKVLPIGSDFPVEGINPLLGFYAAVTRLDIQGQSPHGSSGWYPAEKLTRAQALKGATLDAAYASFTEDSLGSLTPGKKADYVVLDRDILDENLPERDILSAVVKATILDGRIAFGEI